MMKFTVVWQPDAESELADLWARSPDRSALAASANRIDRELAVDADKKGVVWKPHRALFEKPLAVIYSVDPGDRMVKILQVHQIN